MTKHEEIIFQILNSNLKRWENQLIIQLDEKKNQEFLLEEVSQTIVNLQEGILAIRQALEKLSLKEETLSMKF